MTEKFTNKDLQRLLLLMHQQGEALYGGVLFQCVRRVSDKVPTAAVGFFGGKFHLLVNPEWFGKLTVQERIGILKHEALHLVMLHLTVRREEDDKLQQLDNWAADLAINSLLYNWSGDDAGKRTLHEWRSKTDLPRMGLMPSWPFRPLTAEDLDNIRARLRKEQPGISDGMVEAEVQATLARHQMLSDKIQGFPPLKTREWYFEQLLEDEQVKDCLAPENGGGSLSDLLEELGLQVDDHGEWGIPDGEEGEAAKAKLKEIMARVSKECEKTGQWGTVHATVKEYILELLKPEVNWRRQLRNWVGMTRRGNRSTTWRRPNKRCPGLMTQAVTSWTASIAYFVDESGSVSDKEMMEGFGELVGLSKRRQIDLIPFDHEVFPERMQRIKRGGQFVPERVLAGGTSFHAVMDYAKKERKEYDGIIIFTDGEASDPGPPLRGQRRCWLISSRGNLLFDPHPGDTVIKLTGAKNR